MKTRYIFGLIVLLSLTLLNLCEKIECEQCEPQDVIEPSGILFENTALNTSDTIAIAQWIDTSFLYGRKKWLDTGEVYFAPENPQIMYIYRAWYMDDHKRGHYYRHDTIRIDTNKTVCLPIPSIEPYDSVLWGKKSSVGELKLK